MKKRFETLAKKSIELISKLTAFAYVRLKAPMVKNHVTPNDSILIVWDAHLGDVLINGQAVKRMITFYTDQNKKVCLFCTNEVWEMYGRVYGISNVEHYSMGSYNNCSSNLRTVVKTMSLFKNQAFEKIVGMLFSRSPMIFYYIIALIPALKKYVLYEKGKPNTFHEMMRRCFCTFYSNIVWVHFYTPIVERVKKLLNALEIWNYKIRIAYIHKRVEDNNMRRKYITIAVDSSNYIRSWPIDRFIELIKTLIIKCEYDICLIGSRVVSAAEQQYDNLFSTNKRVINLINKTTIDEWIELIRGSQFHIGVDSGSIHVAASVGTQAFCLAGVWEGHLLYPYQIEEETQNTKAPIPIYRQDVDVEQLSCYGCAVKLYYGYGNRECKAACKTKKPCLCLQRITVSDVVDIINSAGFLRRQYNDTI